MARFLAAVFWLISLTSTAVSQEYSISGPDTAGIRQGIEVTWTAPDAKGGIIEIHPLGENTRRVGYAYIKQSPQTVEAPEEPGNYELRLIFDRETKASTPLTVEMVTATLDAPPTSDADPARAAGIISGLTAVNLARTPIAQSVALSAQDMSAVTGNRVLILITDGEETCDGDPAAAIQALRAAGHDIRVNIVGYAIEDANLARTFESWAAAGGGSYFDAADAQALGAAMVAATAPPFRVLDSTGQPVGSGIAGDPPLTLMPGDYTVRIGGQDIATTVRSNEHTTVSAQ
ncbi:hypothetical protein [Pseudooceanicola sp.]|uniref:hypothetical protein n=1 Tax=Pseudooceanicola sp. TaxID=1914328 RepID=UPI0035C67781